MQKHFIVCGFGHVGYRVAMLLNQLGESVTVVTKEAREEWSEEATRQGINLILGDARKESLLKEAGLDRADAVLAVTDSDLTNTEIAVDIKRLHPDLPIVTRIFDQTLAQRLEESFNIRRALATSALAAPTFAAAALGEQIVSSFRLDEHLYVVGKVNVDENSPLHGQTVGSLAAQSQLSLVLLERDAESILAPLSEEPIKAGDKLTLFGNKANWDRLVGTPSTNTHAKRLSYAAGFTLHSLNPLFWHQTAKRIWRNAPAYLRAVFVALNLLTLLSVFIFHFGMNLSFVDALYFVITTVTTTGYGDITPKSETTLLKLYVCLMMILGSLTIATLYSIITDYIVTARFEEFLGRQRIPHEDHYVVVGLGNVGYRIVDKLKRAGVKVLVIEKNLGSEFLESIRSLAGVVIGDARLKDTLAKASVNHARAVIAVTNDDAVNLGIGLEAKQMNPNARVVVRLFDPDFAQKVQSSMNIDAALGAFRISAPTFAAAALYPNVRGAFEMDNQLVIILERASGEEWNLKTPSVLRKTEGVCVLMKRSETEQDYTPILNDAPLQKNDRVLAVVRREIYPKRPRI